MLDRSTTAGQQLSNSCPTATCCFTAVLGVFGCLVSNSCRTVAVAIDNRHGMMIHPWEIAMFIEFTIEGDLPTILIPSDDKYDDRYNSEWSDLWPVVVEPSTTVGFGVGNSAVIPPQG